MSEITCCRICLESDPVNDLFRPCACKGTAGKVHSHCLKRWLKTLQERGTTGKISGQRCEICQMKYVWKANIFIRWIGSHGEFLQSNHLKENMSAISNRIFKMPAKSNSMMTIPQLSGFRYIIPGFA